MIQNRNNLEWNILQTLLRKRCHVRELAKIINYPHVSVLRKLEQLRKNNVVDFKKEGKNNVFFVKKNLSARMHVIKSEFDKLLYFIEKYPKMNIIIESILDRCNEKLIIIFGSYAKFKAKEDSDIDIYVDTKDKDIKKDIESVNSKINVKIGRFDTASNLIKEIINEHVIIKGAELFYEKQFSE